MNSRLQDCLLNSPSARPISNAGARPLNYNINCKQAEKAKYQFSNSGNNSHSSFVPRTSFLLVTSDGTSSFKVTGVSHHASGIPLALASVLESEWSCDAWSPGLPGPNLTSVGTSPLLEWGRPTSPIQRTNGDGSRWRFSAGGATCRRTAAASA